MRPIAVNVDTESSQPLSDQLSFMNFYLLSLTILGSVHSNILEIDQNWEP